MIKLIGLFFCGLLVFEKTQLHNVMSFYFSPIESHAQRREDLVTSLGFIKILRSERGQQVKLHPAV